MNLLDPAANPLNVNLALFAAWAAVVWWAGVRLGDYGKLLAERTGAGQTFIGTLLLGGIVSLPEGAMAVSAAVLGNPVLAVNTLLGGVATVMAILAITDATVGRGPLSSDVQRPVVPLLGSLTVMLLTVAGAGITAGDVPLFGAGAWTLALLVVYVLCILLVKRSQESMPWITVEKPPDVEEAPSAEEPGAGGLRQSGESRPGSDARPTPYIVALTALTAAVILITGFPLAHTADVLAVQTGLGESFIGLVLGGVSTSLPEVSSTISAVRLRQHEMAFGDAFGTNLFSVMLLFAADLAYLGGPILNSVGRFSLFATLLGIATTIAYVAGLIARPKQVFYRMGVDSILVLCLTALGMILLYRLR